MFTRVIDHNRLYLKGNIDQGKAKYDSNTNMPNQNKIIKEKSRLNELLRSKNDKKNMTTRSIIIDSKTRKNKEDSSPKKRGSGYFEREDKSNFLKNSNYHTISEKATKGLFYDGKLN
jgi:hypothetical protein